MTDLSEHVDALDSLGRREALDSGSREDMHRTDGRLRQVIARRELTLVLQAFRCIGDRC